MAASAGQDGRWHADDRARRSPCACASMLVDHGTATPRHGLHAAPPGARPARLAPDLIRRQNWPLMPNAVIVDAVRTPVGRRGGRLSGWHATDLAAQPLAALLARNDLDPSLVEDVVMGCTMTVGEQAMNIARNAALAAGFPESVPGHHGRPPVRLGAAGHPLRGPGRHGGGHGRRHRGRRGVDEPGAHRVDDRARAGRGLRAALHGSASSSSTRASAPRRSPGAGRSRARRWTSSRCARTSGRRGRTDEGRFANEIVPLEARVHPDVPGAAEVSGLLDADEGVRRDTSLEKLADLKPAFSETGTVTAGTSSQISDGAAAVLIMSEERASSLGLRAPGALPHLRRGGQRPPDHADGRHPGHRAGAGQGEAVARRHRRGRDQRGLRLGRAGLGARVPPRHGRR